MRQYVVYTSVCISILFDHALGFLYKDLAVSSKRFKSIASDRYGIRAVAVEVSGHLWISSNGKRNWSKAENLGYKMWTSIAMDNSGLNIVAVAGDVWFSREGGLWNSVLQAALCRRHFISERRARLRDNRQPVLSRTTTALTGLKSSSSHF